MARCWRTGRNDPYGPSTVGLMLFLNRSLEFHLSKDVTSNTVYYLCGVVWSFFILVKSCILGNPAGKRAHNSVLAEGTRHSLTLPAVLLVICYFSLVPCHFLVTPVNALRRLTLFSVIIRFAVSFQIPFLAGYNTEFGEKECFFLFVPFLCELLRHD